MFDLVLLLRLEISSREEAQAFARCLNEATDETCLLDETLAELRSTLLALTDLDWEDDRADDCNDEILDSELARTDLDTDEERSNLERELSRVSDAARIDLETEDALS